jgi:hypothetical protein
LSQTAPNVTHTLPLLLLLAALLRFFSSYAFSPSPLFPPLPQFVALSLDFTFWLLRAALERVLHPTSPFFRDVMANAMSATQMVTVAGLKLITTPLPYGVKTERILSGAAEALEVMERVHGLHLSSEKEQAIGVLRFGGWRMQATSTPAPSNRPPGTLYHVVNGSACELSTQTQSAGTVISAAQDSQFAPTTTATTSSSSSSSASAVCSVDEKGKPSH